jgi:predicted outer membrane repeat protein
MNNHSLQRLPVAIAMALGVSCADAATITVTDGGDAGMVSTCTLRQAIAAAYYDSAASSTCVSGNGADTIVFASILVNTTITLSQGQLFISAPLTITGSGQTINANNASRVLYIPGSGVGALLVSNLTITGGSATGNSPRGAGVYIGGGNTTLSNVTISSNSAVYGAGLDLIGGGTATLTHCMVSGNSALHSGGGIYLGNGTSLTLNSSTLSGNSVVAGGAAQSGGGIYGTGCTGITLTDSIVVNNSGHYQGGGVLADNCPLTMVNTTVTGNTSGVSGGGGIYIEDGTVAKIVNSTISGNLASEAGGILVYNATLMLANTVLSANTGSHYPATADLAAYGLSGNTITTSYSLLGSALSGAFIGNHNVFSDAPMLGPAQNNGGPTQTMALLADSPALNAGSVALASAPPGTGVPLNYDQRGFGFPRTFNGTVDMGAYQHPPADRIFTSGFEPEP